jgi:hypothetical protein
MLGYLLFNKLRAIEGPVELRHAGRAVAIV